jgi:hypothetical protein
VTGGLGCCAQVGGSTPARSAAMRAKWRSKPASVHTIRNRPGPPSRFVNVCGTPRGANATSPGRVGTSASSTWNTGSPARMQNASSKSCVCRYGPGLPAPRSLSTIDTTPPVSSPVSRTRSGPGGGSGSGTPSPSAASICGPTTIVSGYGSALSASNRRSNPPGVQTSR